MLGLVNRNLGTSTIYGAPAVDVVLSRLPTTAGLAGGALAVGILVGIPIGVLAGHRPYGIIDRVGVTVATLGQAIPAFVTAIILILIFAVDLRLLPSGGWGTWQTGILPIATLALVPMSGMIRLARSAVREVMAMPFITLARAKGLTDAQVLITHVVRPSLLPVITFGSLQLGVLLTGAVVTETVFAVPGVGRLVLDAVRMRDHSVVEAAVIVGAIGFIVINFLTDVSYAIVDPRIRSRVQR